jgi:hypothetical protein
MAAGRRVGPGPPSRPTMAPWKKKRLRKRRTGASQGRDSDSDDGEFEIQAEDDARARKVRARGGSLFGLSACALPLVRLTNRGPSLGPFAWGTGSSLRSQ